MARPNVEGFQETEVAMFECQVCGNKSSRAAFVGEVFMVEGRRVLVEHIPRRYASVVDGKGFSVLVATHPALVASTIYIPSSATQRYLLPVELLQSAHGLIFHGGCPKLSQVHKDVLTLM